MNPFETPEIAARQGEDRTPRERKIRREKFRRGIYILPSLFTVVNLCCGFYSIVATLNGKFERACLAIFIALVLDGVDGLVARLTGTTSDFGVQFDSLADMISFGVAPAVLTYSWGLVNLHRLGWITAFTFVICGALRLARFNIQTTGSYDKKYFIGLPIPAAAAAIISLSFYSPDIKLDRDESFIFMAFMLLISALMVSKLRYLSIKTIDLSKRRPYSTILVAVLFIYLLSIEPSLFLMIISMAYAASGILIKAFSLLFKREKALPVQEPEGEGKHAS
jgi:CDP-diacylglycerol--serine O-phosphatidyltransferase